MLKGANTLQYLIYLPTLPTYLPYLLQKPDRLHRAERTKSKDATPPESDQPHTVHTLFIGCAVRSRCCGPHPSLAGPPSMSIFQTPPSAHQHSTCMLETPNPASVRNSYAHPKQAISPRNAVRYAPLTFCLLKDAL